jgi:hypothetical protein
MINYILFGILAIILISLIPRALSAKDGGVLNFVNTNDNSGIKLSSIIIFASVLIFGLLTIKMIILFIK